MPAQLTFQGKILFENDGAPLEIDNFAFCKVRIFLFFHFKGLIKKKKNNNNDKYKKSIVFHLPKQVLNFTEEFYAPPVVIVTVNHFYNNRNLYSVKPENNALNTWIEVSLKYT